MDFSTNRLAALAGLASSEVRHEIVREQAEALNESAEARKSEQNESEVRQAVRRTIRKMIAEGNLNLDEFELASDEIAEGADTHMSAPLPEGAHDEDALYEMDGEMYMEMHGEQGAMKYMLVPMMDEGAHEMEEDMHSMQEQEEPEHTIMYKGVKYVQA